MNRRAESGSLHKSIPMIDSGGKKRSSWHDTSSYDAETRSGEKDGSKKREQEDVPRAGLTAKTKINRKDFGSG
jgi:hypothetical protein